MWPKRTYINLQIQKIFVTCIDLILNITDIITEYNLNIYVFAISQNKCIWMGYIEKVNCTCSQAVIVASYKLSFELIFFKKEHHFLPLPSWREQARTWEHSDGINDKSQKMTYFPFSNNRFISYIASLYLCLRYLWTSLSRKYMKVTCFRVTL